MWTLSLCQVQGGSGWKEVLPIHYTFRATNSGLDGIHVEVGEWSTRHDVQVRAPKILKLVAPSHPMPDVHMIPNLEYAGSVFGGVGLSPGSRVL